MEAITYRTSDSCKIIAERDGNQIGHIEYITYITEGDAAMGTVSFSECVADPRGCDIVVESYLDVGVLKEIFEHIDLSNNLYLETPIVFVTDTYKGEAL